MIRWMRLIAGLAVVAAVLAACGSGAGTAGHGHVGSPPGATPTTSTAVTPGPTTSAPSTTVSAKPSTTRPAPPVLDDAALKALIAKAPHNAAIQSACNRGVSVAKLVHVGGDVAALVTCAGGSGSSPEFGEVYVVDGQQVRRIAQLPASWPAQPGPVSDFTVAGNVVTVDLRGYMAGDADCCASLQYRQAYTVDGASVTAGPRQDVLHPCTGNTLAVSFGMAQGAAGTGGVSVRFTSKLSQPCTLQGYPGLDAIDASGMTLAHAARAPASAPTITLPPGGTASAQILWHNNGGASSAAVLVTPPNTTATTRHPVQVGIAELRISPVRAGVIQ